jgi:hypothetical protein
MTEMEAPRLGNMSDALELLEGIIDELREVPERLTLDSIIMRLEALRYALKRSTI